IGVEYLVRGTLSGSGRFLRYGSQLAIDGGARAGLAILVSAMGWGSIVSYGLVLVVAPLLAAVLTLSAGALHWLRDSPTSTGPTPMAALVATTVASQLVANAGPLAIAILAGPAERAGAGSFVSAITVGRIPLFLFAAVQAAFLPTLSGLVARAAVAKFRHTRSVSRSGPPSESARQGSSASRRSVSGSSTSSTVPDSRSRGWTSSSSPCREPSTWSRRRAHRQCSPIAATHSG
ncbi:MAG TPA: hypothetical protein VKI23_04200, partial [Cellulomonadaceae bacterium]|nr:hypothetical protein [Cellulomonadaceae bacterium]